MKINPFDNPISFTSEYRYGEWTISYLGLREVTQGSPLVGQLYIDSTPIGIDLLFGGPFLIKNDMLYAPVFIKKFCISGFRLCKINLKTKDYYFLTKLKPLIFLDRVEDSKIFFFGEMKKSYLNSILINR